MCCISPFFKVEHFSTLQHKMWTHAKSTRRCFARNVFFWGAFEPAASARVYDVSAPDTNIASPLISCFAWRETFASVCAHGACPCLFTANIICVALEVIVSKNFIYTALFKTLLHSRKTQHKVEYAAVWNTVRDRPNLKTLMEPTRVTTCALN